MLGSLYMVVVLGCADDLTRCEQVARITDGWSTAAACERAIIEILPEQTSYDYPMVVARCEVEQPARIADSGAPAAR